MNRFIKHVIDMNVSRIVGKSPTLFLPADITFKLPIIAAVCRTLFKYKHGNCLMHQQVLLPVGRAPDYRIQMSVALHLDMRTFFFFSV